MQYSPEARRTRLEEGIIANGLAQGWDAEKITAAVRQANSLAGTNSPANPNQQIIPGVPVGTASGMSAPPAAAGQAVAPGTAAGPTLADIRARDAVEGEVRRLLGIAHAQPGQPPADPGNPTREQADKVLDLLGGATMSPEAMKNLIQRIKQDRAFGDPQALEDSLVRSLAKSQLQVSFGDGHLRPAGHARHRRLGRHPE
jgi:hypothetical protein